VCDSKKIVEVLNTNTQNLANNVQEIVDKLKTEVLVSLSGGIP
jgi:hypothetical protein